MCKGVNLCFINKKRYRISIDLQNCQPTLRYRHCYQALRLAAKGCKGVWQSVHSGNPTSQTGLNKACEVQVISLGIQEEEISRTGKKGVVMEKCRGGQDRQTADLWNGACSSAGHYNLNRNMPQRV